uniref:Uncharacterized protein AlNc14C335G10731 n=1 Tax=Albugo laibachii Nc14 TaxID=890382 RepID=F0WWX0_9STRA|nr:conserved hypothetical protein [Albugo laibachii Nc14]|eukprot:CCA25955.1 conserved hypothetical protein [Albugo laibachii Nc14]
MLSQNSSSTPPSTPRVDSISPPKTHAEPSSDLTRVHVERFVDALMTNSHPLRELLNESFSMEMLELLLKRMTAKLRMNLFARERIAELISISLDENVQQHTRTLATSFLILGNAANSLRMCEPGDHNCRAIWATAFEKLRKEAKKVSVLHDERMDTETSGMKRKSRDKDDTQAEKVEMQDLMTEMEELVQAEVNVIREDGERSRKMSFLEDCFIELATLKHGEVDGEGEEKDLLRNRTRSDQSNSSNESEFDHEDVDHGDEQNKSVEMIIPHVDRGILSPLTANLASQILHYFAVRGEKGGCILHYLAYDSTNDGDQGTSDTDLLLGNIGHDDIRTFLLHLCYSDHTDASMEALFVTQLFEKLLQTLVSFTPPRSLFGRDTIENSFLLLREMLHAPYLTPRGVAISAKTIPIDRITGQEEYVSISGASRDAANSAMRKYTSRKVRRIVHLCMANQESTLSSLFDQMIKELAFWSTPIADMDPRYHSHGVKQMDGRSHEGKRSLSLLSQGLPRPACATILMHLFELTETVEFAEAAQQTNAVKQAPTGTKGSRNTSALSVALASGIDCANFMCATHLVHEGRLVQKKKLLNKVQPCLVQVNCMLGVRVTSVRARGESTDAYNGFPPDERDATSPKAIGDGFVHNQKGFQSLLPLEDIESVESSDWHPFGFIVKLKSQADHENKASWSEKLHGSHENKQSQMDGIVEYFAAASEKEQKEWMGRLEAVISGDLNELEVFCTDDWRNSVREYRRLRECLITGMERHGHELIVFLKQVILMEARQASGYHLWSIVKFLNAVVSNESRRLDRMFVSTDLLGVLLKCFEKYPMWNLLLGEITKMLVFFIGDFKGKRSRKCPVIDRLLDTESPKASLLPLLERAFNVHGTSSSSLDGTDAMSNIKLVVQALKICYTEPKTRSQLRIQTIMGNQERWQSLFNTLETKSAKDPTLSIMCIPIAVIPDTCTRSTSATSESKTSALSSSVADAAAKAAADVAAVVPTQPVFQESIIHQITRPSYSSAYGFGSSFIKGDGCVFGYLFQERSGNRGWQKALVVYEYTSYKLWYFYPGDVEESHRITWKWIIPLSVRARYTHGQTVNNSSIGHHGLYITAYGHDANIATWTSGRSSSPSAKSPHSTRELHFSATKLEDRDQWKHVLSKAVDSIQTLSENFSTLACKLKKTHKSTVSHCEDCKISFKLFRRPHGCHRCGKWLCGKCSSLRKAIPEGGIMTAVRHCKTCFEAAGGAIADIAPVQLFRRSSTDSGAPTFDSQELLRKEGKKKIRSGMSKSSYDLHAEKLDPDQELRSNENYLISSRSNLDLFVMAHGIESRDTVEAIRTRMTRQDSIDSPTSAYPMNQVWNVEADSDLSEAW